MRILTMSGKRGLFWSLRSWGSVRNGWGPTQDRRLQREGSVVEIDFSKTLNHPSWWSGRGMLMQNIDILFETGLVRLDKEGQFLWYRYLCCWWDDQKKSKDMGGGEPCWWITFRICGISMGEVFPGSRWAPAAPHRLARWTSITRWGIAGRQHHIYAPVFNGNWILSILWRLNDIVNA